VIKAYLGVVLTSCSAPCAAVNPETAAKAIIIATTDLAKASEADRKLDAAALIDTIELIEVTQLRGGVTQVLQKTKEARAAYPRGRLCLPKPVKICSNLTSQAKHHFQNSMIWIWISELVFRREPTASKLDEKARHRLV
jgi:hypothetical protein